MVLLLFFGCIERLEQIGGTGSIYTASCSADMEAGPRGYTAQCTPPTCLDSYRDAGIHHVAVALDPGRRVIGLAQRVCVQDLSTAAARFEAPDPDQLSTPDAE